MHIFKIEDGETFWHSAESAEQALDQLAKDYGCDDYEHYKRDYQEVEGVTQLPSDKLLTLTDEDEDNSVTKTCGEWAAEFPNQCICATVW